MSDATRANDPDRSDPILSSDYEQRKVRDISRAAGSVITVVAALIYTVIGVSTVYYIAAKYMVDRISDLTKPDFVLWKITLVLYFSSWILGPKFDKTNEEDVYVSAPRGGRLPMGHVCAVLSVAILFALMAMAETLNDRDNLVPRAMVLVGLNPASIGRRYQEYGPVSFLAFLNVLWVINVPLWLMFVRGHIVPMSRRSQRILKADDDRLGLQKVRVMDDYIMGRWQAWRFATGAIYLIVVDAAVYLQLHRPIKLYEYIAICGFVVVFESWVWLERLKARVALRLLEAMSIAYTLTPRASSSDIT